PRDVHGEAFDPGPAAAPTAGRAGLLVFLSRTAAHRTRLFQGNANGAAGAAVRLLQRDRDLRLDVATPRGGREPRAVPPASAKERLEEVAESPETPAARKQVAQ